VGQETILADRYRLVSPLERGGTGQVWEGRDERLDRPVAVKLLTLAGRTEPDDEVRRFTREAVVTARLSHPGVPAIHDAGEYDDGLFLVMELVDGMTVGDLVAEHGPLPVPWAAAIGAQVAAVLTAAHTRDVVHGDVKSSNVIVTGDGTAKILDFGLAPEQPPGEPATPAADLYALGCLLYEMLAGQPVVEASSPAPLTRTDVDVPFTRLVWQLLATDPVARPSGAREVYDQLLAYVAPSGPAGDIDLAATEASGMLLYSRPLVRLTEASPSPATQVAVPAPQLPEQALRHSLWVAPAAVPLGMTTWLSFGYIGVRHRNRRWLAIAAAYLAVMLAGFVLFAGNTSPGPMPASAVAGLVIVLAIWPAGFVHALWVNFHERLPLIAAGSPQYTWRKR
jgi:serine/threonine protein kinase